MQALKYLSVLMASAFLLCQTTSCSDEPRTIEEEENTPDSGPQRFKPQPNGMRISEDAACTTLFDAREAKNQALKCIATSLTCPSLVRVDYPTACLEYDQGSVQGCVAHYNAATTCDDLKARVTDCLVSAYPGSEPAGCP